MMKKIVFGAALLLSALAARPAAAQEYNWGVGARLGAWMGPSVKYNFNPSNGVEAIVGIAKGGFRVTGLYERTIPFNVSGLNFYYGAGLNFGNWKQDDDGFKNSFGIDGIAGIEYRVQGVPLAFSVDYKPYLELAGHDGFGWSDAALTIRFVF